MKEAIYTLGVLLGMAGCWALERNNLRREGPQALILFFVLLGTSGLLTILGIWGIHLPSIPDVLGFLFGRILE